MGIGSEENAPNSVKLTNLLTASPEELMLFKEKISQNGGDIFILVHPYYQTRVGGWNHKVVDESYPPERDLLIRECLATNRPLLIFEEDRKRSQTEMTLQSFGHGETYFVLTQPDTHKLTGGEPDWNTLVSILKESGVTHAVLGGMWMQVYKSKFAVSNLKEDNAAGYAGEVEDFIGQMPEYSRRFPNAADWINDDLVPLGCAGMAVISLLKSGIDVSISSASTPCALEEGHVSYMKQEWAPPDLSGEI